MSISSKMKSGPCARTVKPRGAPAATLRETRCTARKFGHDGAPRIWRQARPLGDLVNRSQAARAQARIGVDHTDIHAGAIDLVARPGLIFHGGLLVCFRGQHNHAGGPDQPKSGIFRQGAARFWKSRAAWRGSKARYPSGAA